MKSQSDLFKKILLAAIVLILPAAAFSQKLEKPTVDKFSNDTTYSTSQSRIAADGKNTSAVAAYVFADALKIKNNYVLNLELDFTLQGHNVDNIPEGNKVFIKLGDNSVIDLASIKDAIGTDKTIKMGVVIREFVSIYAHYGISKGDIQKILSGNVTAIRIETHDQKFDFDVQPKESDTIKKTLQLLPQ
jgi:hypothetical protein